ncbi:MAG: PKD domain-containing protein [Albidovulum sp.]
MKTHKILTACLLIMMGMYAKAQIGCQAYYYFNLNGNTVQFIDTSYSSTPVGGTISYSYLWTFSDGSSSTQQNPLHSFAQPGTYNVCLLFSVAQNGVTFCSDTFCNSITISPCSNPPVVTVTGNSLINAGQSTTLTATAALGTAPYFYVWSTGANTAQITVSPTTTTTYCVTVYDNMQCSASYCHIVQVNTSTLKPLAADDSTCTTPSNAVVIDVLNNDQQLSSPTVSILGTSTGTTTLSPSGALGYEPNTGFNGTAYIYYSVCNSNGLCDTGKVSVWVSPNCTNVNHPPVAQPFTTQMCNTSSGLDIDLFQVTSDPDMNDSLHLLC